MTRLHNKCNIVSLHGVTPDEQLVNDSNSFYLRFNNNHFCDKNDHMCKFVRDPAATDISVALERFVT